MAKAIKTIAKDLSTQIDEQLKDKVDVNDIETVKFSEKDVVRHKLVQDIIKAYDKYEEVKRRK